MKNFILICLSVLLFSAIPVSAQTAKLGQLDRQVNELKEDLLRQKIKLRHLEEAVLFGKITATTALVAFKMEVGNFFKFISGEFFLNDKMVFKTTPVQLQKSNNSLVILDEEIPPGNHQLRLRLLFSGRNKGPFTYLEEYQFEVKSQKSFHIAQGRTKAVEILVFDRGTGSTEVKDRLAVNFTTADGS